MQTSREARGRGERAHRLGVIVNLLLAILKIIGGTVSKSPSLLADGYHSIADLATNLIAWLGFRVAAQPPDEDHHYGHGKAEAAAAAFVGTALVAVAIAVLWESVDGRAQAYEGIQATVALGAAVLSLLGNEWLVRVTMRSAARLSYEDAETVFDGGRIKHDKRVHGALAALWQAYEIVDRGRAAREPLDLDLPERKVVLAPDGSIDRIVVPPRLKAHRLVDGVGHGPRARP